MIRTKLCKEGDSLVQRVYVCDICGKECKEYWEDIGHFEMSVRYGKNIHKVRMDICFECADKIKECIISMSNTQQ